MSDDDDRLGLERLQVATIDAIVGAFECARPFHYSRTARWKGDAGGFSYGTHQVSHTSGNLHKLLQSYVDWTDPKPDPDFARRVKSRLKDVYVEPKPTGAEAQKKWKAKLEEQRLALIKDDDLKSLLELAAQDPAMRKAQDAYFYKEYLKPALKQVKAVGFKNALSWAVAFDSAIHSGPGWWDSHKDDVDRIVGAPASAANETAWIQAYLKHRHEWLLDMAAKDPEKYGILKDTVYRPNTFKALAEANNWTLALPVKAHSYTITAWDDFAPDCFTDPVTRDVDAPDAFGELGPSNRYDGRAMFVQRNLKLLGFLHASATADGIYGGQTRTAVEDFQQKNGLPSTGKVDGETYKRINTQVRQKLAEKPDAASATPDGLRPMAEQPKGNAPIASGTAAAAAAAGTAAVGVVAGGGGSDESGQATADAKTGEPETAPVSTAPTTPTTPVSTAPTVNSGTQTGTEVASPAGKVDAAEGWGNPALTLGFCALFLATIVLAAWFFRKTSHA